LKPVIYIVCQYNLIILFKLLLVQISFPSTSKQRRYARFSRKFQQVNVTMRNFQFRFYFSHYVVCLVLFLEQSVQLCLPFVTANHLASKHVLVLSFLMEIYWSMDTETGMDNCHGMDD
jgi:hypothetical protein